MRKDRLVHENFDTIPPGPKTTSSAIVIIQLFAGARELAGAPSICLNLPDGATVADLRRALILHRPEMSALLARSRIAVDREFADDSAVVPEGAEVALIPPVSGG